MARTGRPTKLTADVHNQIVAELRRGYCLEHAAELVGVGRRTIYTWLTQSDDPYKAFTAAVDEAIAHAPWRPEVPFAKRVASPDRS
jgi:transposase